MCTVLNSLCNMLSIVQTTKCICLSFKMCLCRFQNVFVQVSKCVCSGELQLCWSLQSAAAAIRKVSEHFVAIEQRLRAEAIRSTAAARTSTQTKYKKKLKLEDALVDQMLQKAIGYIGWIGWIWWIGWNWQIEWIRWIEGIRWIALSLISLKLSPTIS